MSSIKPKEAAKSFIKDFQAFICRGNVIDLSVAVIVGAGFNVIVSSFTKDVINPLLGILVGKPDFTNLFWVMKMPENYTGPMTYEALNKAGAAILGYCAFLTAFVKFVLLALVIFCFLRVITVARKKLEAEKEKAPAPAPKEEVLLLREILAELKKKDS